LNHTALRKFVRKVLHEVETPIGLASADDDPTDIQADLQAVEAEINALPSPGDPDHTPAVEQQRNALNRERAKLQAKQG